MIMPLSTNRPTMRWLFQCFEGISLEVFQPAFGPPRRAITTLEPLHCQGRWQLAHRHFRCDRTGGMVRPVGPEYPLGNTTPGRQQL